MLGLSGGIDSALTLAIAADIFDKKDIEAVLLPSKYTSNLSLQLAKEQCELLGIDYSTISIKDIDNVAKRNGFRSLEKVEMPAYNLCLFYL